MTKYLQNESHVSYTVPLGTKAVRVVQLLRDRLSGIGSCLATKLEQTWFLALSSEAPFRRCKGSNSSNAAN